MTLLELRNVGVSYGDTAILKNVSLTLDSGEWLMIVGPNGAGKSTLISAVSGVAPYT
ncbi:MAG: ATP-binding cassette domain-containing protein, partial [Oscillospiraceae bacterium]|nr:ATP-binding cassette domain-containing protein [Oscillospiraceae bacterium]